LLFATYQDTVLAGIMIFTLGHKAWCMYAASGNSHRNLMSTYLLHWEGIRWARAQGCTSFDYCGIPDEVGQHPQRYAHTGAERSDGPWGVYRFKRGFGGWVVRYVGAYDHVYHRPSYWLYNQAGAFLQRMWGETWHRRLRSG
jgi:peptidoglycan pentaglycine glycine transferase (the first glycine)